MHKLNYEEFKIQKYLISSKFSSEEKHLLFSLRSNCYPAKNNFKNMNKGSLLCTLKCRQVETQYHIFEDCEPVLSRLNLTQAIPLDSIYGSPQEQKSAVEVFLKIDKLGRDMINKLLPGEDIARTHDDI